MTKNARPSSAVLLRHLEVRRNAFTLAINEMRLRPGEITCIVGANGSGKTTLLLSILGLLPHEGTCYVHGTPYDGVDPYVKSTIGFIPDDPTLLFDELTAREQWSVTATVIAGLQGNLTQAKLMERAEMLAASIGFDPPAQLAREYSHGMRKKTQIVQALLGKPAVIVVDELRNGLDPIAIKQTEQLMKAERERGAAICAATHDLWWAERFADHIIVLDKGSIGAEGSLRQLLQKGETNLESAFLRIIGAKL